MKFWTRRRNENKRFTTLHQESITSVSMFSWKRLRDGWIPVKIRNVFSFISWHILHQLVPFSLVFILLGHHCWMKNIMPRDGKLSFFHYGNERKALPVLALPRDPAQHLKEKGKQAIADAIICLFSPFSFVVLAFLCPLAGSCKSRHPPQPTNGHKKDLPTEWKRSWSIISFHSNSREMIPFQKRKKKERNSSGGHKGKNKKRENARRILSFSFFLLEKESVS